MFGCADVLFSLVGNVKVDTHEQVLLAREKRNTLFTSLGVKRRACAFCSPELFGISRIFCTKAFAAVCCMKASCVSVRVGKAGPLAFVYSFFTVSTHFTLIWSREKNTSIFHKGHFDSRAEEILNQSITLLVPDAEIHNREDRDKVQVEEMGKDGKKEGTETKTFRCGDVEDYTSPSSPAPQQTVHGDTTF